MNGIVKVECSVDGVLVLVVAILGIINTVVHAHCHILTESMGYWGSHGAHYDSQRYK